MGCRTPELNREWGRVDPIAAPEAPAAPATVCGSVPSFCHWAKLPGKAKGRMTPRARRPAGRHCNNIPSGVTGGDSHDHDHSSDHANCGHAAPDPDHGLSGDIFVVCRRVLVTGCPARLDA